jgi:putative transposase
MDAKRALVETGVEGLSVARQCELLDLARSSLYHKPCGESPMNLTLMRLIDAQYLKTPTYGVPRMTAQLRRDGWTVNPKRVRRLMRLMNLEAVYPKPRLSGRNPEHRVFPYLLRSMKIDRPNQVWATDITYIPLANGFVSDGDLGLVQSLCCDMGTLDITRCGVLCTRVGACARTNTA